MAKSPPTPAHLAMQELGDLRQRMRDANMGIGEPAIEIPIADLSVFTGADGEKRIIIGMDKLLCVVDRLLHNPPVPAS
jgi:hypothetical protein